MFDPVEDSAVAPPPAKLPRSKARRRPELQEQPESSVANKTAQVRKHVAPLFMDASGYNFYVIDTFLRIQDQFPEWFHNELLSNISTLYGPYNWALLSESDRGFFVGRAEDTGVAFRDGIRVQAAIIADEFELVDVSEEEFVKDMQARIDQKISDAAKEDAEAKLAAAVAAAVAVAIKQECDN